MNPRRPAPNDEPDVPPPNPEAGSSPIDPLAFVVTADAGLSGPGPDRPAPPPRDIGAAEALPPFELRALRLLEHGWGEGWEIRPSPPRRDWMDEHTQAYQCLPLVVANQWGWQVTCPTDLRVVWDGSPDPPGLWVDVDPRYAVAVKSQFGRGIVTFSPPWLFRTPPGWDLLAKGPANLWKPNRVPLEGIIETWWLPYTFTFNWKLVEPGEAAFAKGEPIGQLVPVPHETFRSASAVEEPIGNEPELEAQLLSWRAERRRRAGGPRPNHLRYRKAQDVEGHLVRVPVPPPERPGPQPE